HAFLRHPPGSLKLASLVQGDDEHARRPLVTRQIRHACLAELLRLLGPAELICVFISRSVTGSISAHCSRWLKWKASARSREFPRAVSPACSRAACTGPIWIAAGPWRASTVAAVRRP